MNNEVTTLNLKKVLNYLEKICICVFLSGIGLLALSEIKGLEFGSLADWSSGILTFFALVVAYHQMVQQHQDEKENIEEIRKEFKTDHVPSPKVFLTVIRDTKELRDENGDKIGKIEADTYHLEANLYNLGGSPGIYKFYRIVGKSDFDKYKTNLLNLKNEISSDNIHNLISPRHIDQVIDGVRSRDFKVVAPMQSTDILGFSLDDLKAFSSSLEDKKNELVIVYEDILGNLIYRYFVFDGETVKLDNDTMVLNV